MLPSGTRLGPYEVRDKLGEGGMGEVYRARDAKLNRDVALKILPDLVGRPAPVMADLRNAVISLPPVGNRFLVATNQAASAAASEYRVILNWTEELKALAATKK